MTYVYKRLPLKPYVQKVQKVFRKAEAFNAPYLIFACSTGVLYLLYMWIEVQPWM